MDLLTNGKFGGKNSRVIFFLLGIGGIRTRNHMELTGTHNHFATEALKSKVLKGVFKCMATYGLVHFLIKTLKDI